MREKDIRLMADLIISQGFEFLSMNKERTEATYFNGTDKIIFKVTDGFPLGAKQ